jgi:hypothetical protein
MKGRRKGRRAKRCILHFTLGRKVYRPRQKNLYRKRREGYLGMNVHSDMNVIEVKS